MIKHIILFAVLIGLVSSCSNIENPSLKSVTNVDVVNMSTDLVDINAEMVFHNPNSFSLDLANTDMIAYVDDIELAVIKQNYEATMPANTDFNMPVNIKLDLKKLYKNDPISALSKGYKIMAEKKLNIKFVGSISVGKGVAKVSVPIDQVETVNF